MHTPILRSIIILILTSVSSVQAEPFTFVVLGDTTYEIPEDYPAYRSLINSINQSQPSFSIHVGDTKGWGDCGEAFHLGQLDFFNSYEQPVFYAPGNNEWADCWKDNRGNHDPIVVLNTMRRIFFSQSRSMGKQTMALVRQADDPAGNFPAYAENARWSQGLVTFLSLNVVGEHNNQMLRDEKLWKEFVEREQANVAWINAGFAAAREQNHKAIVIAMHSDIFTDLGELEGGAFQPILETIAKNASEFGGQVLVAHGHEHTFIINKPIRVWDNDATTTVHDNVTRLQVYGWPDMKAVSVSVDTDKPWVFGFEPLYGAENLSPSFID